ncbi:hypothetical protein PIB30_036625 [Stylosanthes scabra]|uniref:DUF4283 domain-containing protein n=1 Tax=Stylosanthes scabra TaxID=79078 RepID=A0ABU6SEA6_9FABA|nr:hypothetical protein [Stylosanthes scabra]
MDNYNLVRKIISRKEFGFGSIKAGLMGIWGNPTGVVITEVGRNTILISFNDHEKGRQIFNKGPWSFREETIGRAFGTVVETEDPVMNNLLHRSFLRVKLFMDISRPLPTGIWMPRPNLPKVWVSFRFERIQDSYCLKYGIIGHNKREYNRPVAVSTWDPLKPRYLPGLGVSRPPPIQEIEDPKTLIQVDSWENEITYNSSSNKWSQCT